MVSRSRGPLAFLPRGVLVFLLAASATAPAWVSAVSGTMSGKRLRITASAASTSGQGRWRLRCATPVNSFSTCTLITPPDDKISSARRRFSTSRNA